MKEIWKNIYGYEGLYQISNYGKVKSLKYGKEQILKPLKHKDGYLKVILCKYGKMFNKLVHRLVAEEFLPNPNNLLEVNHKDEVKQNNFVWVNDDGSVDESKSNLEWCDRQYNIEYSKAKEVLQFSLDGVFIKSFPSTIEIERQLGFSHGNISSCCLGKLKSAYGFIWKYKNDEQN